MDLANGATLTITPSKTYDIVCSHTRYVKDWYRVHNENSVSRYGEYTRKGSTPEVYATNTGDHALTLHFESFQSTDSGEYECRLRSGGLPTQSVFLSKFGTFTFKEFPFRIYFFLSIKSRPNTFNVRLSHWPTEYMEQHSLFIIIKLTYSPTLARLTMIIIKH